MLKLKLGDAQRVVLAAAAARESGLVLPLSKSVAANQATASRILKALLDKGLIEERAVQEGEPVWRGEVDGRTTLSILPAGLEAVGIAAPVAEKEAATTSVPGRQTKRKTTKPSATVATMPPKPQSKLGLLLAALRGKKGATIDELTTTTGWQPHSVRGAISGVVKKKFGLNVASAAVDGRGRVYRVTE